MQSKIVETLPKCTECIAEERPEAKDATFGVLTPMKQRANLCDEHFMNYVETRLGSNTVWQIVMAAGAGGAGATRRRNAA